MKGGGQPAPALVQQQVARAANPESATPAAGEGDRAKSREPHRQQHVASPAESRDRSSSSRSRDLNAEQVSERKQEREQTHEQLEHVRRAEQQDDHQSEQQQPRRIASDTNRSSSGCSTIVAIGGVDRCSLCDGDWATCFAGHCVQASSVETPAVPHGPDMHRLNVPLQHQAERFEYGSSDSEIDKDDEEPAQSECDDATWWSTVEQHIAASAHDDGYFAHSPSVVVVGDVPRRRVTGKRPALPSEVASPPKKQRRPG